MDTLYGDVEQMFQPDYLIQDIQDLPVSDLKPCQSNKNETVKYEVIAPDEVAASSLDDNVDIRPRVYDNATQEWVLVDTGSQVSVIKPGPNDKVNPLLRLEAVNGTEIPCYGKKAHNVRLGRKTYHIDAVISDTTDTILGMDFL